MINDIELDTVDREILRQLQTDGRMSNVALAEKINLSPPACLRRVQRLEQTGVIDRYVMMVNEAALNWKTTLFVEIALQSQTEEAIAAFENAVSACPGVMECYMMSGQIDYLLRVVVADTLDYERLHRQHLSRLPGVARIRSSFSIRKVFHRTAVPI